MAVSPATSAADPFRTWLRVKPTAEMAARLGVSAQTVRNWLKGAHVARGRVRQLQLEAARDGVVLSAEELIGVPGA